MNETILAEDLLFLAYDPRIGRPMVDSARLSCGLAGAILADLALSGRVDLDGDRLRPGGSSPSGDSVLDGVAEQIAVESRTRKIKWWVQKLQSDRLRRSMLTRATERGILDHERGRMLGIFPTDNYRPVRWDQREQLRDDLHAVLTGGRAPDPRSVALLALTGAVRVESRLFPDLSRGVRKQMMKEILVNDRIGVAVRKVIQSIEAATATVAMSAGGDGGGGDGGGGS